MRSDDGDADGLGIRAESGGLLHGHGAGGGGGGGEGVGIGYPGDVNPYRVPRSDPWSPNSVGISLSMPSPELDGRPITPGSPVPGMVPLNENGSGMPTAGQAGGNAVRSASPLGPGGDRSSQGPVSPPVTGSGTGSGAHSRNVSELGVEGLNEMSARGSWRDWISPEAALAGGLRDGGGDGGGGAR